MTPAKTSNWKEYLNTVLLSVVSYLIIDIHLTFKTLIKDVEDLKIDVAKHDYILNLKKPNDKKDISDLFHFDNAILPNNKIKVKKDHIETKS